MWAAIGPAALLDALTPLARLREAAGPVRLIEGSADDLPEALAARPDTLLVLEEPVSPSGREAATGPLVGPTCVGWLRLDASGIAAYAATAVALAARPAQDPLLILLGPREARYAELLDEVAAAAGVGSFRWSAERIRDEPMLRALRSGPAAALYAGHGSPAGWSAYGGVTAAAFTLARWDDGERIAGLFSLACGTGASGGFADQLIAAGAAGAILAPTGRSLHSDTRRLAPALAETRARLPGATLADVLMGLGEARACLAGHAVIGDPAIQLRPADGARSRCAAVSAPPPDHCFD